MDSFEFKTIQKALEIPYSVVDAPVNVRRTWGYSDSTEAWVRSDSRYLMYPSFILELRDVITQHPLITPGRLSERASLLREKTEAETAFVDARKRKADRLDDRVKSPSSKRQREAEREHDKSKLQFVRRAGRMDIKQRLEETQKAYLHVLERLKEQTEEDEESPTSVMQPNHDAATLPNGSLLRSSPFAKIRIAGSASAKLNYIIDDVSTIRCIQSSRLTLTRFKVQKFSLNEKILVFSKHPLNLLHIAEALELIGVKFLQFASESRIGPTRDQILALFEKEDAYRVLLMELKHGARGLNIVSASRVIFCEPVWHADVQSQAIKVKLKSLL